MMQVSLLQTFFWKGEGVSYVNSGDVSWLYELDDRLSVQWTTLLNGG